MKFYDPSSTRVGLALLLLSSSTVFASPARVKRSFQGEERGLAWEQVDGIAARGLGEGEEMRGFDKRAALRAARTLPASTTSKAALRSARTLPVTTTTVKSELRVPLKVEERR